MKQLTSILKLKNDEELFHYIVSSFKEKITQWDYFVNWKKVFTNIKPIEHELNLLNVLVGKDNFEEEALQLIKKYPSIIKALPYLIAVREKSIDVLIDTKNFIYRNFSFTNQVLDDIKMSQLIDFMRNTGLESLIKNKQIKNLVDYTIGVEVGLDSNGRKNRSGALMEALVEDFVQNICSQLKIDYLPQADAKKIKSIWNMNVQVDKSSRIIDFVINNQGKLFFIECNFYGGGGSKLKSTATEYIEMNAYWNQQGIEFIWVTDGAGWASALKPLREFFDKSDYLLNLEMLKKGILESILIT